MAIIKRKIENKYFQVENEMIDIENVKAVIIEGEKEKIVELDIYHKMIYITLCRYADNHSQSCFPSYNTIAKKLKCTKRIVIKKIKDLTDVFNLIEKDTRKKKNSYENESNIYYLNSPDVLLKFKENTSNPNDKSPEMLENQESNGGGEPHSLGGEPHSPGSEPDSLGGEPVSPYKDLLKNTNYKNKDIKSVSQSKKTKDQPKESTKSKKIKPKEKKTDHQTKKINKEIDNVFNNTEYIFNNIDFENLKNNLPKDKNLIEEIELNLIDFLSSPKVMIEKELKPQGIIHKVLSKLKGQHIVSIITKLKQAKDIKNKKAYLRTMLYNAALENNISDNINTKAPNTNTNNGNKDNPYKTKFHLSESRLSKYSKEEIEDIMFNVD